MENNLTTPVSPAPSTADKKRKIPNRFWAAFWAIAGGNFGCHHFYLRQWKCALPYIILTTLGFIMATKICAAELKTMEEMMAFAESYKLPDRVTGNPTFIWANIMMTAPFIVSFVEGLVYLCTSKEKWEAKWNNRNKQISV